jgi:DNA-binding CsgD family transcriptional regulator
MRSWTGREEGALRRMRKQGRTYKEIGRVLGRSANSVKKKAQSMLLARPRDKRVITSYAERAWSTAEEEELMKLKQQGLSYKQIAGKLGRSIGSVKQKYHYLKKVEASPAKPVVKKKLIVVSDEDVGLNGLLKRVNKTLSLADKTAGSVASITSRAEATAENVKNTVGFFKQLKKMLARK